MLGQSSPSPGTTDSAHPEPERTAATPPEQRALVQVWSAAAPELREAGALREHLASDVRCILALGSALLGYGLPAHRVEEAVLRLSRALGRSATVFGLPTYLSVTFHEPHGHEVHSVRAEPGSVDLGRLEALHRLVGEIERGEVDARSAEQRVHAIVSAARPYSRVTETFAVVIASMGGTLLLGGSARDAAAGTLMGAVVGLLLWLGISRPSFVRVLPVIAAVVITSASVLLSRLGFLNHPLVVTLAALFVFLPGLTLTLAMTELATGHLVSGTARSVGALTVFLQLGLGVLFGARLGNLQAAHTRPLAGTSSLSAALTGATLLAVGFAILFAVRRQDALATFGVSALAFGMARFAGTALGAEVGALSAAFAVGLVSHAFARLKDRPSSTLMLPGIVMLVPGSLGMLSVSAAALHEPGQALDLGFQMVMVVVALSTGVLLAAAALPPRSGV